MFLKSFKLENCKRHCYNFGIMKFETFKIIFQICDNSFNLFCVQQNLHEQSNFNKYVNNTKFNLISGTIIKISLNNLNKHNEPVANVL